MSIESFTGHDHVFTARALELAAGGIGLVSPGPLVGCVIVSKEGCVVGEGTYVKDNVLHAEVIALRAAGEKARGGTAYVSLEPHAHHGTNPPCTEALITAGIRRVVAPIEDPNPLVAGKGFRQLREAGIEILTGIMSAEAEKLNEKFICWHRKGRPFVHLKLACSLDGRISLNDSVSTMLSSGLGKKRVHEIRHEHDAILVGGNTVKIDRPALTDRSGLPRRRPLVRIVLDNRLQIPLDSELVITADQFPTIVFTNCCQAETIKALRDRGVEVIETEMGGRDLKTVLNELKKRDLQSVLVEGGAEVAGSFVDEGLVDKFTFLFSPKIIGGREAPVSIGGMGAVQLDETTDLTDIEIIRHERDIEITGYPARPPSL